MFGNQLIFILLTALLNFGIPINSQSCGLVDHPSGDLIIINGILDTTPEYTEIWRKSVFNVEKTFTANIPHKKYITSYLFPLTEEYSLETSIEFPNFFAEEGNQTLLRRVTMYCLEGGGTVNYEFEINVDTDTEY